MAVTSVHSDCACECVLCTFPSLQSLTPAADGSGGDADAQESPMSIGFTDLRESLNELEDHDLDALVADLRSGSPVQESPTADRGPPPPVAQEIKPAVTLAAPPTESPKPIKTNEAQTKAEKIKLALEKLKEAKLRKLIIKVLMSDDSSKTLMVDERQTVRDVLDNLFEKTHCERGVDWSLCETNPELLTERGFEDHEHLVERLSAWTRNSQNKIYFVTRPQKYVMFTDPQLFYMWKKKKSKLSGMNSKAKEALIKESFGGSTVMVPDLEGTLYLKEDGKKVWKARYFVLRASGIYYVPKGKTKSSTDLARLVNFEKVNVYTASSYRQKYRAPTDFCFILKHPCIQMESPYIRFLCCDDEHSLLLWVNAIRIAKYGTVLYENYRAATRRASAQQALQPAAAHRDITNDQTYSSSPKSTSVEDYPYEPPPDFIPPPPPPLSAGAESV
ncbi:amyloid beta A4 precursor protein-binding family B member 1-interacting protein-like isoform 1-T1 [Menidia menidia]